MGRGSYLGGSTIINTRSSWRKGPSTKPKKVIVERRNAEQKKRADGEYEKARMSYLARVVAAAKEEKTPPSIPNKAPVKLRAEVKRHDKPLDWARTQKEFSDIVTGNNKYENHKHTYLAQIVAAQVEKLATPPLFKKVSKKLEIEVGKYESPLSWARAQKGFDEALARKRKKVLDGSSSAESRDSSTRILPIADNDRAPDEEIAAAEEDIRRCEKSIRDAEDLIAAKRKKISSIQEYIALLRRGKLNARSQ
jgi:hypothetical protein